jgi:hypothetical protein
LQRVLALETVLLRNGILKKRRGIRKRYPRVNFEGHAITSESRSGVEPGLRHFGSSLQKKTAWTGAEVEPNRSPGLFDKICVAAAVVSLGVLGDAGGFPAKKVVFPQADGLA